MDTRSIKWGRFALVTVLAVVCAALVAPAGAFATTKATTRIIMAKSLVVNNDTVGVKPWPATLKLTLQKKVGSKWGGLYGYIRIYRLNDDLKTWTWVNGTYAFTAGTATFRSRGRYKLMYEGSSKAKVSTAYVTVYETIGGTASTPTMSIDPIDGSTDLMVSLTYNVTWNTDAWNAHDSGPVVFSYWGDFHDAQYYSAYFDCRKEIWDPGQVQFSYRVTADDILDVLHTNSQVFVWQADDPYVLPSDWLSHDYPMK